MKRQNKLLVSIAVSMALYGTSVSAEEAQDAEEEQSNVVVVTAQKRTERVAEVPIAISVFASEAIDQTGIQELRELGDYIPNMVVTQGTDFNSRIVIRGVGAASRNIGFDSRVGVYLDGVYLGQGPSVNQDLVDLERVEVLRGPQGTLFGKNTVAGAVSLVSKKPSGEFEGKATVNVGNFNALEAKLNVDFAITDEIAAKLAISSRSRDGYIKNVYTEGQLPTTLNTVVGGVPVFGIPLPFPIETNTPPDTSDELNNQDTQSFRAQLRIRPSDELDINIALDGLQSERMPILGVPITTTFGDTPYHFSDVENNEVNYSFQGREERDISGLNINVEYDFDNEYAFRSITAFRDTEIIYQNDTDYSPLDFLYLYYEDDYEQTTQEFQLISPDDSDFKYVVGLYYYSQEATSIRDAIGGNAAGFFGIGPGQGAFQYGEVDSESSALYLSGSYQLSESLKLGFGARYSDETKDVVWDLDGTTSGAFGIGTTPAGGLIDSRSDSHFSPAISLNYAMSESTHSYIKASTGFKSGGFNLDFITPIDLAEGITFEKETVRSLEVGLKTSLLDERLTLNMAYFDADYEDYQVNQFFDLGFDPVTGTQLTSIRITNAAEVDTSGFELEANYKVSDALTINASLGFLDATFADFPGGTSAIDPVDGSTIPVNAAGNKLPGSADFNASLGIQYYASLDSVGTDLLLRLDMTHTGDYFTTIQNEKSRTLTGSHPLTFALDLPHSAAAGAQPVDVDFGYIGSTTMLNGRIGLIGQEGFWEVYLWGRNLTDEATPVDSFREFFGTLVNTPRQPRTYGVEVSYNF
ncbi:MAG: TonB-dependent receptor [Kangiellaceae bacterium]|nr:TonB-dependent receptor [Kangiellaceae bacterium]